MPTDQREEIKINLLFKTASYFPFKGRDETSEGLDRKFSLYSYARMRFINQLSPLLAMAANISDQSGSLSRVVSVLDPNLGRKMSPNFSDPSLKRNFFLKNCALHASAMNNLALEKFAKVLPGTSFIHAYPSVVVTGVSRDLGLLATVFAFVLKPISVGLTESGERHLFAATAPRFVAKAKAKDMEGVVKGGDDIKGSGAYFMNWDCETLDGTKNLVAMRENGAEKNVWDHTQEVFEVICNVQGKY